MSRKHDTTCPLNHYDTTTVFKYPLLHRIRHAHVSTTALTIAILLSGGAGFFACRFTWQKHIEVPVPTKVFVEVPAKESPKVDHDKIEAEIRARVDAGILVRLQNLAGVLDITDNESHRAPSRQAAFSGRNVFVPMKYDSYVVHGYLPPDKNRPEGTGLVEYENASYLVLRWHKGKTPAPSSLAAIRLIGGKRIEPVSQ